MKNYWQQKFNDDQKIRYFSFGSISMLISIVLFAITVIIHFSFPYFDNQMEKSIVSITNPILYDFFEKITELGNYKFIIPVILVLLVILLWKRKWETATELAFAVLGGGIFGFFLKILFSQRSNTPYINSPLGMDLGFPSGHALMAFLLYGYITYKFVKSIQNPLLRWMIGISGASLVFLIGMSRLFIAVHLPTDVLGGWVMGVIWIILSILITKLLIYRKLTELKPKSQLTKNQELNSSS